MIKQIVATHWSKIDGVNLPDAINRFLEQGEGSVDITGQQDIEARITGNKNLCIFEMQVFALKNDSDILHIFYSEEDEDGNVIASDEFDEFTQKDRNAIRSFTSNLGFDLKATDTREELFREMKEVIKEALE